jgi:hypothetical protein
MFGVYVVIICRNQEEEKIGHNQNQRVKFNKPNSDIDIVCPYPLCAIALPPSLIHLFSSEKCCACDQSVNHPDVMNIQMFWKIKSNNFLCKTCLKNALAKGML